MAVPVARGAGGAAPEEVEIELLLEGIYRHHHFDFRGYARASLRRRLWHRAEREGVSTISGLQERVLHDPSAMDRLLRDLSINVTEMFRDPGFFRALREQVVPGLRTFPYLRVWNAGCSTGEETASLAILLAEEGLLDRTRIYATDMNETVLAVARSMRFPAERVGAYADNYTRAGGTGDFARYVTVAGGEATLAGGLLDGAVFAQHNLAQDASFNAFHLVLCRNVLIYFGRPLQERVHALLHESLVRSGVLGLGRKETLLADEGAFDVVDAGERLYRRRR